MRIVIDLQGAQSTGSRNRGIGRYTLSLAQAIARNRGDHEIFLALNGLFPDSIEPIRAMFDGLLPQKNIHVWYSPGPVNFSDHDNDWRRQCAELLRESVLANMRPDMVLVTSLFEGLEDDAVTSVGEKAGNIPTAVVLYDLIPFIHKRPYLENPVVESWYLGKIDYLRRADLLLAISESSRQEGIQCLDFADNAVVNISTAADPHFVPRYVEPEDEAELRKKYGLTSAFVMYTGGIDHRKNIDGLIRAYARLPEDLRGEYQLAIVCSVQSSERQRLEDLAIGCGLKNDELVLTGFVPEEDLVDLYNLCAVFVFPSWHEGFGLPALEAMSCRKAVIGANTSSLPEVIGREDALFDPHNEEDIAAKLLRVLTDDRFRLELEKHSLEQSKRFSWEESAQRTMAACENWHKGKNQRQSVGSTVCRPRLAYISPLPPERSGISDYSAELLPELARHYDIEVIVAQDEITDPFINAVCPIRTIDWFRAHAQSYDRILYHFGNSPFHQHMFDLLEEIPGVVVLHDFFLSHIVSHLDYYGIRPNSWVVELYRSHGYKALQEYFHAQDPAEIIWKYPCSLGVLQNARGVIVHSENSRRLARQWYSTVDDKQLAVIPLLRVRQDEIDRSGARRELGFKEDDFVVSSFGLLGPTKLNHRLFQAWFHSCLAQQDNCFLIFVGENHLREYEQSLATQIRDSGLAHRVRLTGWADSATFRHYLAASDVGVQLRTCSRGETSAAVLDCMNYGLATIINANGSMADLPEDGVWKLSDDFSDTQLVEALEALWRDTTRREQLGKRAREIIFTRHEPRACAERYKQIIETFYESASADIPSLVVAIANLEQTSAQQDALSPLSAAIAQSIAPRFKTRQLLVDISELAQRDSKTGIQRVVRSILYELLINPPVGFRVEPVYATVEGRYKYASHFTLNFLACPSESLCDELIECQAGDVFLGLDLFSYGVTAHQEFYQQLRRDGVDVRFVVYDLLPLLLPHAFIEGVVQSHLAWLNIVAESDGAICISKAVADELAEFYKVNGPPRLRPFKIDWFHLGADVENSVPTYGLPDEAEHVFQEIALRPTFLIVGTIEPRKGQAQTLAAFELLWKQGVKVNLVIVGKQGWMVEALMEHLRQHPELNRYLFLLEGISDEYLEKVYAASTCLIAASEAEGFGLPLIEAAQHKLPIIARDIPVFKEVAGEHAFYFGGVEETVLEDAIKHWLTLYREKKHPTSDNMPWLTWRESAQQLLKCIV